MAILSDIWPDLAETDQAQLQPCASGHMDAPPRFTKPGTPGKQSHTEGTSLSLGTVTREHKPLSRRPPARWDPKDPDVSTRPRANRAPESSVPGSGGKRLAPGCSLRARRGVTRTGGPQVRRPRLSTQGHGPRALPVAGGSASSPASASAAALTAGEGSGSIARPVM